MKVNKLKIIIPILLLGIIISTVVYMTNMKIKNSFTEKYRKAESNSFIKAFSTGESNSDILGDINNDYKINGQDRTYILKYVTGAEGYELTEQTKKNSDVNADGKIDYKDYLVLKKYLVQEEGYETLPVKYVMYGDVNHDYKINGQDRTYILKYVTGEEGYELTEQTKKNADVNADGKIDYKDYLVLKKCLLREEGYETLPVKYVIYGDVNHDYNVNSKDRTYILKYVTGAEGYELTEQTKKNADVNADRKIDYKDYLVLKNFLVQEEGYETLPVKYVIYGDVNHDYKINGEDRTYILKYVTGEDGYELTEQTKKNADVNADGKIDYKDYLVLKKCLLREEGYETLPVLETICVGASGNDLTGDGTEKKPYLTINQAFKVAKSGDKIKLLSDTNIAEKITLESGKYTLDLNGYKLTENANNWITPFSLTGTSELTVIGTIENSKIETSENCEKIFLVRDNAKLHISGGAYINNTPANQYVAKIFLVWNNGGLKIDNGYFEAANQILYMEYLETNNIEILGGDFCADWPFYLGHYDIEERYLDIDLTEILGENKYFYDVNQQTEAEISYIYNSNQKYPDYSYIKADKITINNR